MMDNINRQYGICVCPFQAKIVKKRNQIQFHVVNLHNTWIHIRCISLWLGNKCAKLLYLMNVGSGQFLSRFNLCKLLDYDHILSDDNGSNLKQHTYFISAYNMCIYRYTLHLNDCRCGCFSWIFLTREGIAKIPFFLAQ